MRYTALPMRSEPDLSLPRGPVHAGASHRGAAVLRSSWRGLAVAGLVLLAWLGTLTVALTAPSLPWAASGLLVLLATLLNTGLFITAHDAMHGVVAPGAPRLNDLVGRLALGLYAAFAWEPLRRAHLAHHAAPARPGDPDFHDGARAGFWSWYLHFIKHYVSLGQVLRMAVAFNVLVHVLGISQPRLMGFWVLPALLSTLQLFYFGTYRPHREPRGGYADEHRATSHALPAWLSFLTCFHFGYHHEHHANPRVPWWRLPAERARAARGVA